MWGYQQHFQFSANYFAKNLFNQIDDTLNPSVFIIGILVENRVDRHEICLEPEDCGYSVDSFADLKNIANKLEEVDEESKVFHSHEIAQENHKRQISNKAFVEAIKKILNREDVYGSSEKFVSKPTYVDGFQVFIILEINKLNLNKHYALTKNRFNDRYEISRSLIESTINIYLKECSIALKDPNIGLDGVNRTSEEILREAGKSFMYTISQAGDNMNGLHGLYEACNIISSLKYEGTDGLGKMIIAKQKHPN